MILGTLLPHEVFVKQSSWEYEFFKKIYLQVTGVLIHSRCFKNLLSDKRLLFSFKPNWPQG